MLEARTEDVDSAVDDARKAQRKWWSLRTRRSGTGVLLAIADGIERDADSPGRSWRRATSACRSTMRRGRSMARPRPSGTTRARRSGGAARRSRSKGGVDMTFREPIGVVGVITPWNFPLTIASWKIAPALGRGQRGHPQAVGADAADRAPAAAPSPTTPGLPGAADDARRLRASSIGRAGWSTTRASRKIAFTGSTAVGREIAERGGEASKRVTLELGRQVAVDRVRRRRSGRSAATGPCRRGVR